MYLYENDKDKVLVYEFSPIKKRIIKYKKDYLNSLPKDELFSRFDHGPIWGHKKKLIDVDWYCPKQFYSNVYNCTDHDEYEEEQIIDSFFKNDGKILENVYSNDKYYVPVKTIVKNDDLGDTFFEALNINDKLKTLHKLEWDNLDVTLYREILELFKLSIVREYRKQEIDELVKYGLINESSLEGQEVFKTLKKAYNETQSK